MRPILTQADQFPDRVASVRRAMYLVEMADRITGAVIQPGDTGSGGPMFSDDNTLREKVLGPSIFGPVIDPPTHPPTNIADATAVPNADYQAQAETGTGNRGLPIPPEPGGPGSGGGQFNPEIQLDTSMITTSGPPLP
jgi:hypothetical protein